MMGWGTKMFGLLEEDLKARGIEVTAWWHHTSKYHDPSSEFYIGVNCVNCPIAMLERRIKEQAVREMLTPQEVVDGRF